MYENERTVNGKVYQVHDLMEYIGDAVHDIGLSLHDDPDWFPSSQEWRVIADVVGDMGNRPADMDWETWSRLVEYCAKHYVGYVEPKPDPEFWQKIKAQYPMCTVEGG